MKLWAIYPELLTGGLALLLVPVAGWARGKWQQIPFWTAVAGLTASVVLTARMLPWQPFTIFKDTYAVDGFSAGFKLLLEIGGVISLLIIHSDFKDHPQKAQAPIALLFTTLGGMGLVSAIDLGLIVLFIQMLSLASYLLVGLIRKDPLGNEATLKYFIYAAAALAIMAYGLTFLYGMTGSLNLLKIGPGLIAADSLWVAVAFGFILMGYGFEMTLVPFHFWAPDVYQGTTAPVAGFLSVVPKIAGFAGLLRFLLLAFPGGLIHWPLIIAILAAVTMFFGNLAALRQRRLKRLLAYSSIAQAGYLLMAVAVSGRAEGAVSAAGYYLAAYLFMNLGAFAVITQLERALGTGEIASLQGLGKRSPVAAAVLAVSLLSLAGIPPLAGFIGKIFLLEAAIDGGMTWLAVIGIINMVIGLYYYLAVTAQMYFKEPVAETPLPSDGFYTFSFLLTTTGTLLLGVLPAPVLNITRQLGELVR
ncbi:MAG: NADH-quinone oxidoreductase subunit N [Calditrichia bacterium]